MFILAPLFSLAGAVFDRLFIGWRFTKNVELQCASSPRFARLACSGAAPPPAAPPKLSAQTNPMKSGLKRKNAKILKNFL
jgi:hypothetical protein